MLRLFLFSLFLALVGAAQAPFKSDSWWWSVGDRDCTEWNLNKLPNPNDTNHLIFETVYSLLQHWPNTRMRNGHNIVPGIIPKGTLLYHGSSDEGLPHVPDWVATDPEHAYLFCKDRSSPQKAYAQEGCWLLTLVTTRPLKILYFDGSSAAKLPYGSLDTQELLIWGKVVSDGLSRDGQRIEELCKWGRKFNVDAFVRMEMNFEVMLCDFTSGVIVASLANIVNRRGIPSMSKSISFEAMNSGSRHNYFPGETRVQLDLSRLISFYDTELVPSLVPIRAGQERWDHRAGNVSTEDLAALKSRLEALLVRYSGPSSGFDWRTLFQIIVDRFAGRFELTRHLLNSSAVNPDEILDLALKTQTQLRIMLTPYILFSIKPTDPLNKNDLDWTIPVYKSCAMIHTEFMESELDHMTASERLLLQAVQGTSREICRVVTKMWAVGVYAGIDPSLNTKNSPNTLEITQVWSKWGEDLNELMTWLDWSVWVKCNPNCGFEQMCYLTTWPFGFPHFDSGSPSDRKRPDWGPTSSLELEDFAGETWNTTKPESDDWVRPRPRCVSRVAPYSKGSPA